MEQLNLLLELASVDSKFICILHPPIGLQPVVFSIVDRLIANILCHSLWNRSSILLLYTTIQWTLWSRAISQESYKLGGRLRSTDDFLGRKLRRKYYRVWSWWVAVTWQCRDNHWREHGNAAVLQDSLHLAHLLGTIFVWGLDEKSLMGDPLWPLCACPRQSRKYS